MCENLYQDFNQVLATTETYITSLEIEDKNVGETVYVSCLFLYQILTAFFIIFTTKCTYYILI